MNRVPCSSCGAQIAEYGLCLRCQSMLRPAMMCAAMHPNEPLPYCQLAEGHGGSHRHESASGLVQWPRVSMPDPLSASTREAALHLAECRETPESLLELVHAVDQAEAELVGDDPPHPGGRASFVRNLVLRLADREADIKRLVTEKSVRLQRTETEIDRLIGEVLAARDLHVRAVCALGAELSELRTVVRLAVQDLRAGGAWPDDARVVADYLERLGRTKEGA